MTTVLFWDIDGTLITTGRAGIFAWENAARAVFGRTVDFSSLKTAGLTDMEIAHLICKRQCDTPDQEQINRLVGLYERYLPDALPRRNGAVLPGVIDLLTALEHCEGVASVLLTGNTKTGAAVKLLYYGLAGYFDLGAYSGDKSEREEIARHALALCEREMGSIKPEQRYVIGDTPHDIRCGRAIDARTMAVASGDYDAAELVHHNPWRVMEQLPSPMQFLRVIGFGAGVIQNLQVEIDN